MFPVSTTVLLAIGATPAAQIRLANLADEAPVHLGIALRQPDADGLSQLLAAQRDPTSPSYHAWLDPAAFGARFGLSEADYASVLRWFSSRGFAVTAYPNHSFFEAVGRVDGVRAALGVQLHGAELAGRRFRTFDGEVALPPEIGSRILHIAGLDTRPRHRHRNRPRILIGNDGVALGPDDLRLEYDMTGLTAGGQAAAGLITAVLGTQEGTTNRQECGDQSPGSAPFIAPSTTAIQAYFALAGASAAYNPIVLPNPNDDFDGCKANVEFQLDVEMQSVGAANAKSIDLVLSPASEVFVTGAQYIVNSLPAAVVVSTSLGLCEAVSAAGTGGGPTVEGSEMQVLQQTVQQGLAEGQTWFAASGDNGADDCSDEYSDSGVGFAGGNATVDFPGVLPEIVDMGGAQFGSSGNWAATGNLLAFISEVVWNEGDEGGGAGGGGQSLYFKKPAFQIGVGPEASDGARDVPDLALEAASGTPGVAVYDCGSGQDLNSCSDENTGTGNLDVVGGTSVASPLAAGMFALLSGAVGCRQGDVHAEIYALGKAQHGGGAKVFNDITSGNNDYADPSGDPIQGFSAAAGYDLATGWGSIDLAALVANWPSCDATATSSGTSTGAMGGGSSTGSSTTTGGGSSSGGSSTGGTTGAGSSTGSSTGGSSTGSIHRSGSSTGGREGQISIGGGCSSASGGAGQPAEMLLAWGPLAFVLLGLRKRQR